MSRTSLASRFAVFALVAVLGLSACDDGGDAEDATQDDAATEDTAEEPAVEDDAAEEPADDAAAEGGDIVETVTVEAGEMYFEGIPDTLPAGTIQIDFNNVGGAPHDIAVEGAGDEIVAAADGGQSDTGTITLEPGEYVFYCTVGNHRAEGMEQTVTVQ